MSGQILRSARRVLSVPAGYRRLRLPEVSQQVDACVAFFYIGVLLLAVDRASSLLQVDAAHIVDPLWPVCWVSFCSPTHIPLVLAMIVVAASFVAATFPRLKVARIAAAIGFWEASALLNSFGKISHHDHMILWLLVMFVFLPTRSRWNDSRRSRFHRAEVFWYAQALIMFFYGLTGFWKVVGCVYQVADGQPHLLQVDSLARQVAVRLLQTNSSTPLGDLFVAQPWIGWPMFLGAVYLEWGSFVLPFRPRLHRLWGASLISMHLGIGWVMGIWFHPSLLVCGILLLMSPFQRSDEPFFAFADLPGVPLARKLLALAKPS